MGQKTKMNAEHAKHFGFFWLNGKRCDTIYICIRIDNIIVSLNLCFSFNYALFVHCNYCNDANINCVFVCVLGVCVFLLNRFFNSFIVLYKIKSINYVNALQYLVKGFSSSLFTDPYINCTAVYCHLR